MTSPLLPTPTLQDGKNTAGPSSFNRNTVPLNAAVTLLPTPAVNDMGASYTPDEWDAWTERMKADHGNGNGHGKSLEIEAQRLLPTPTTTDALGARNSTSWRDPERRDGHSGDTLLDAMWKLAGVEDERVTAEKLLPTPQAHDAVGGKTAEQVAAMRDRTGAGVFNLNEVAANEIPSAASEWGIYASAITRWSTILGRAAPNATQPSKNGRPQLAPAFVEWMMGLTPGWVTDCDVTRNEALKMLGNGVCPQQAAHAITTALSWRLP